MIEGIKKDIKNRYGNEDLLLENNFNNQKQEVVNQNTPMTQENEQKFINERDKYKEEIKNNSMLENASIYLKNQSPFARLNSFAESLNLGKIDEEFLNNNEEQLKLYKKSGLPMSNYLDFKDRYSYNKEGFESGIKLELNNIEESKKINEMGTGETLLYGGVEMLFNPSTYIGGGAGGFKNFMKFLGKTAVASSTYEGAKYVTNLEQTKTSAIMNIGIETAFLSTFKSITSGLKYSKKTINNKFNNVVEELPKEKTINDLEKTIKEDTNVKEDLTNEDVTTNITTNDKDFVDNFFKKKHKKQQIKDLEKQIEVKQQKKDSKIEVEVEKLNNLKKELGIKAEKNVKNKTIEEQNKQTIIDNKIKEVNDSKLKIENIKNKIIESEKQVKNSENLKKNEKLILNNNVKTFEKMLAKEENKLKDLYNDNIIKNELKKSYTNHSVVNNTLYNNKQMLKDLEDIKNSKQESSNIINNNSKNYINEIEKINKKLREDLKNSKNKEQIKSLIENNKKEISKNKEETLKKLKDLEDYHYNIDKQIMSKELDLEGIKIRKKSLSEFNKYNKDINTIKMKDFKGEVLTETEKLLKSGNTQKEIKLLEEKIKLISNSDIKVKTINNKISKLKNDLDKLKCNKGNK